MSERLELTVLLDADGRRVAHRQAASFMGMAYRSGIGRRRWVLLSLRPPVAVGRWSRGLSVPDVVLASGECVFAYQSRLALHQAAVRQPTPARAKESS